MLHVTAVVLLTLATLWAPADAVGSDAYTIGGNSDGIDYRSRTQMYVNLVRQAQPFMANETARAAVDASGWPIEDFSALLQTMGTDQDGNYSVSIVDGAVLAGVRATSSLNITSLYAGSAVVGVHADPSQPALLLATLAVGVDGKSNVSDIGLRVAGVTPHGVSNMSVLLPGFERSDVLERQLASDARPNALAAHPAAQRDAVVPVPAAGTAMPADVINPKYLQQLDRFSTVRLLPLLPFNRDFIVHWADRSTVANSPSWSGFCCPLPRNDSALPWEQVADFVNALPNARSVWLNLPVLADDDYFVQLATLLKARLRPSLTLLLEYGNELWNGGFPSVFRIQQAAQASVAAGDPFHLNYDHCDKPQTWGARYSAYNAAVRVPALFAKVYGASAVGRGAKVQPLLGGQADYAPFIAGQLAYLNATQPGAIARLEAMHVALYFALPRDAPKTLTGDQVLALMNQSLSAVAPNFTTAYAQHAALAVVHGLAVRGYESGPGTFGPNNVPAYVAANTDPRMQGLVERMYAIWQGYGFRGDLNYFHAGAMQYDWPYGQWSLTQTWAQPVTPKTLALDAVRARAPVTAHVALAVPFTNYRMSLPVGYYAGGKWRPPAPVTYVVAGANLDFLVRMPAAGSYAIVVHAATRSLAVAPGCSLDIGFYFAGAGSTANVPVPPTNSTRYYLPTRPVKVTAGGSGVAVVRVTPRAVGLCARQAGTKTLAQVGLASLDVTAAP